MTPMTIPQILDAAQATLLYPEAMPDTTFSHVCYDSRKLRPGDLFLPLPGQNFDGHSFIDSALQKGAAGCFTMWEREHYQPGKVYCKVPDTTAVPRLMGEWYRARLSIPFIGITGSVGKTTTKDMVAAVLSEKFCTHKTLDNHNNALGVPMTLWEIEAEHQVSVVEMGMSSFGEIENLSDLVRPAIALITNIGDAHIENLGSREGILKAKCEIFSHMEPDAPAILNGDDSLLMSIKDQLGRPVYTCGVSEGCDYFVTDLDRDLVTEDLHCTLHTPKTTCHLVIPAVGDYMIYPVLMAAAVAERFGMTGEEIARGVLRYAPTKMRMNVIDRGAEVRILDDGYNANPQSMRAGIQTLAATRRDYKMAILGDMLELGNLGPSLHQAVGKSVGEHNIQCLVAIGELAQNIAQGAEEAQVPEVYWFPTKKEALPAIAKLVQPNSAILVKASRKMQFEEITQYLVSITPEKDPPKPV